MRHRLWLRLVAPLCLLSVLGTTGGARAETQERPSGLAPDHRLARGEKRKPADEDAGPFRSFFEDDGLDELNARVEDLYEKGSYGEALPLARQAVAVAERRSGEDRSALARALNNLAWLLQAGGDYAGARPLFERALAVQEQSLGADSPEVAVCLNNLAALLAYQGDYKAARPLYERSLRISENALGADHPDVAKSVNNLAALLESSGDRAAALPLYERALRITEASLGPNHPDLATTINNIASILQAQNKPSEARELFLRALSIREKALGADHPDVAASMSNLALSESASGNLAAAEPLLLKALEIYRQSLGPEHPDVASALSSLGKVEWLRGKRDKARDHFLEAAGVLSLHVEKVLPTLSFAEQRAFLSTRIPDATSLLLSTCREGESMRQAYDKIFRWKGLLIEALRWQAVINKLVDGAGSRDDAAALEAVRAQLAGWYHSAGSVAYPEWKKKNDELTARKEELERRLARSVAGGLLRDILQPLGLRQFLSLLAEDEALIDIYRYELLREGGRALPVYGAVICDRSGPLALVDLGHGAGVDALLKGWRRQVLVKNEASEQWRTLAQELREPLAERLPSACKKIWLSPDSELSRLPWHLVFAESHLLSQLDSARELAALRQIPLQDGAAKPVFLLAGDVDFSGGEWEGSELKVAPLPGTLQEAEALKALAQEEGLSVEMVTGKGATKARVLSLLPRSRWVHLATHGFFFDEAAPVRSTASGKERGAEAGSDVESSRNPLVESGLVLARAAPGENGGSGSGRFLTAEEMVGLDLGGVQSMTLSACETGLGEEVTGQGVMGLRAAIMSAGARGILMSLWKVPDASTLKLMQSFYRHLWVDKMPRAEALRKAQETVRNEPYERFKNPVHWAAWVLVGEGW